jgi:hypothetical protein
MDPLSITASSIAVIQLITKTSTSISSFIRNVRESRSDLDTIDNELQSIRRTIELLHEDLTVGADGETSGSLPDQLEEQIAGILQSCITTVKDINETLERYRHRIASSVGSQIRWALNGRTDIQKSRMVLESQRRALQIAVDVLTWTIARDIKKDTTLILEDTSHLKKDTARILEEIATLQNLLLQNITTSEKERGFLLDRYLESLTEYTESVWNDITSNRDSRIDDMYSEGAHVDTASSALNSDLTPQRLPLRQKGELELFCAPLLERMGFQESPTSLPKSLLLAVGNQFTEGQIPQPPWDIDSPFKKSAPLFVCGAFLFPAAIYSITQGVTLRDIARNMTPAILRGYQRRAVKYAPWPALIPSNNPTDEVLAMALFGLSGSQREALHNFQNGMFDLNRATIEISFLNGSKSLVEALVYVWNGSSSDLVSLNDRQWSASAMLRSKWLSDIIESVSREDASLICKGS